MSFITCIAYYSINGVIFSKATSSFCFCKFLWSNRANDLFFCLNRATPWLELCFKFNRYSIKPFQKTLVGFHNLWIHLSSKEFNWVSMLQIPFFVSEKILYCFFNFLFDRFSNSIYFASVPKSTISDLVYHSLFSYQRKLHSVPNIDFFW